MFSGIIKAVGKVIQISDEGSTKRLTIKSPMSERLTIDQSVSHDGVCLTIIRTEQDTHDVQVVAETISKTIVGQYVPGEIINLEKAITPATLLDGHLVQGHVDGVLRCVGISDLQGSWKYTFHLPAMYQALVIPHGSICLNGVSLTVANIYPDAFEVAIIPYTYAHTNFCYLQEGDMVNVEFDLIGKYILRQAELRSAK